MKKIFILIAFTFIFLCSCNTYKSYSVVVDYSRYAIDGFFITESNSVNFQYMPVGHVVTSVSGHLKAEGKYRIVTADDALYNFVSKCKQLRGNAAINVQILVETDKGNIVGYRVSGMAVKAIGESLSE